jgi:hypothetical protein
MTRIERGIEANTAYAEGQKRAANYFTNELLEAKKHFSHIEGFATLTEANIRAVGGVLFLSNLRLHA